MKLVIQIPCWNEESAIAETIRALPAHIDGIDVIDVVIIDDGSTDRTAAIAAGCGVAEVVTLSMHRGLADAFAAGVATALRRGADILINTDADHQYPSRYIPDLVRPIIEGWADITVGDRLSGSHAPFPPVKMLFQRIGSLCVKAVSGVKINDATSGFRAFNSTAMESMIIHGRYSYTLESLIVAGKKKMRVVNVPIEINPPKRPSRLFKSIPRYIAHSSISIIRAYLMYHPLTFFASIGSVLLGGAGIVVGRFLYFYFVNGGSGHLQSLILAVILAVMGFQSIILGLVGDVIAANRRLLEDIRHRMIREECKRS